MIFLLAHLYVHIWNLAINPGY